jgi:hypothetical protein
MFAVVLALVLMAFQPTPMTIEDCLLRSGYSHTVEPTPLTGVIGVPAPEWETVLSEGDVVGYSFAGTDTGNRVIILYAWNTRLYVFVGKSNHDPNIRLPGEPSSTVHGDCLLKVGSDG